VGYNGYLGGKVVFDHGLGTAPVQRHAPTTTSLRMTLPEPPSSLQGRPVARAG
jgi:hypothetical protein